VQEGLQTVKVQAEGELKAALDRVAESIGQVALAKGRILERAQSEVVDLSLEIARRVLHRELTTDPSALEGVVRAALQKLTAQEITRVRVDPMSQEAVKESLARYRNGAALEVVADPTLGRGSVIFEIHNGSLDASIETQLREIERGFADRVQNR
jgi:flagellar assembly protein FliH